MELEQTANLEMWELILGFSLPLVLAFIIQSGWSRATQAVAAFVVSAAVTILTLLIQDDLDTGWDDPTASVLKVLALTIAFYQGFWKPTGVAPAIERSTTFGPRS